jgi:hypothetical protein
MPDLRNLINVLRGPKPDTTTGNAVARELDRGIRGETPYADKFGAVPSDLAHMRGAGDLKDSRNIKHQGDISQTIGRMNAARAVGLNRGRNR